MMKTGSLVAVHRFPIVVASSVVEHRLSSLGSVVLSQAQLPCGMWNLPRPGIKLMSRALAGRFSTTGPPGKSRAT